MEHAVVPRLGVGVENLQRRTLHGLQPFPDQLVIAAGVLQKYQPPALAGLAEEFSGYQPLPRGRALVDTEINLGVLLENLLGIGLKDGLALMISDRGIGKGRAVWGDVRLPLVLRHSGEDGLTDPRAVQRSVFAQNIAVGQLLHPGNGMGHIEIEDIRSVRQAEVNNLAGLVGQIHAARHCFFQCSLRPYKRANDWLRRLTNWG